MNTPGAGPLLSIIVPTFNSAGLLTEALASIAVQSWRDFEVLISDGASRDETLAVAQRSAGLLPLLRVDSRPDAGVYDAINRAIEGARGEWVLVLGSDDRLHAPDTLATLAPWLRASRATVLHGDVRMMARSGHGVEVGGRYAGPMPLERLVVENVCQQAIFYRRRLFAEIGGFDLRYRLHADWDFNLRAALREPFQWVDVIVADYAATGMSSREGDAVFAAEMPEMLRRHLAGHPGDRTLWPLHRRLLRNADALRRRGRWREAFRQLGTYVGLRLRRNWAHQAWSR